MTCKDCLYFNRCVVLGVELNMKHSKEADKNCRHFKNKADYVEVKWINVKNMLPEEDVRVLVCCCTKKGVQNINLAYQINGFWHGSGSMSNVTHWQPLPKLPEGADI